MGGEEERERYEEGREKRGRGERGKEEGEGTIPQPKRERGERTGNAKSESGERDMTNIFN